MNHNRTASGSKLSEILADANYLRERRVPRPGDVNFLAFADLLRAVEQFAGTVQGRLFDYGCGGAPYRDLFLRCAEYVRADVSAGPEIDRVLEADGRTAEADAAYDVVFSAQVLEHLPDPDAYLRECHRILRPGGRLFVSTHGMFQEHGCPFDYRRWTAAGLEAVVRAAGFEVVSSGKLTTELRGLIQLQHHFVDHLRAPGRPFWHYPLALARKGYQALLIAPLNWMGEQFPDQGLVPGDQPCSLYVGVCVEARKPAG